jgi:hypothetical protein
MPAMSPRRAALPALAAALGLLLTGCGGGSSPSAAGPSGPSASSRPASSARPSASPSASASTRHGLLTGDFCADLNNLGKVAGLTARQARRIKHDRKAAASYLSKAARDFTALGKEGGPQTARFMTVLAGQYQSLAAATLRGAPLARLESKEPGLTSPGASGAAFRGLATYVQKHCH